MADDFDAKMNALMGRMTAWKSKGSSLEAPTAGNTSAAIDAESSNWEAGDQVDVQALQSTVVEIRGDDRHHAARATTVTFPSILPATPDFHSRPSDLHVQSPALKSSGARDAPVEKISTAVSDYRDDFSLRPGRTAFEEATPLATLLAQQSADRITGSTFEHRPGASSEAPAGAASIPGEAAFDNQMNALEARMAAWKTKAHGHLGGIATVEQAKSPLSTVQDTRQSLASPAASPPASPPPTQKSLTLQDAPATVPALAAARPALSRRNTVSDLLSGAITISGARSVSPSNGRRQTVHQAGDRGRNDASPASRQTVHGDRGRHDASPARRQTIHAGADDPTMTDLVPHEVWESKAPAHHTSYAFLSGMSSTRTAYSYAETLPASAAHQEDAVQFSAQRPGTNTSIRSGYSSLNSSTSCPVSQPVQEAAEVGTLARSSSQRSSRKSPRQRGKIEHALEVAGGDRLSLRVSSLEESMHNVEHLLRCLVKENPEVRDTVRHGRKSKAKLLGGPTVSGSLEAPTSTLGTEPEHEPSWFNEQSQRSRLRASSAQSLEGGRGHAAMRAPIRRRNQATTLAATADKASEVTVIEPVARQHNEAEDEELPVRRGRFHWPLDIVHAREELREEVRKDLSLRWR